MTQDNFDRKISQALRKGTKQSSEALHEENFNIIMNKINEIEKGGTTMPKENLHWAK